MQQSLKETIIYGGAFNPPTRAHQAIVQGCIDYAEPRGADVWLLPSGSRRDKTIDTPYERRIELLKALLQDVMRRTVHVEILTRELECSEATETIETVRSLAATYPDRRFRWVFGSDSVATMPAWREGGWLQYNLQILAVERPGEEHIECGPNVEWLEIETGDVRSTEVRRRIAAGEEYGELVGVAVKSVLRST